MNATTRHGISIHQHVYNIETVVHRLKRMGYDEHEAVRRGLIATWLDAGYTREQAVADADEIMRGVPA